MNSLFLYIQKVFRRVQITNNRTVLACRTTGQGQPDFNEWRGLFQGLFHSFVTPVNYPLVHILLKYIFLLFVHRQERRRVQVLSAKIALVCLCAAKLQDKYQYLFTQLADHNNCLSRRKLHALLDSMVAITDYLSESLAFSPDLIPATVDSCFQQVRSHLCV